MIQQVYQNCVFYFFFRQNLKKFELKGSKKKNNEIRIVIAGSR